MRKSTIERMLQLADIKPIVTENKIIISNFELTKNSVDGKTYAIVRENKKYHIKEAQTKENLKESDFDYVGGVANKMKKSFNSFSDATKHLNLMFEEINNHHEVNSINLLESDNILSEKKFVLKLGNKKQKKDVAPIEEPSEDIAGFNFGDEAPSEDAGDKNSKETDSGFGFGGDEESEETDSDFGFGGDEESEETEQPTPEENKDTFSDEEDLELEDSDDEIKDIQSTTGKLGQQLRDVEDISSDMMKWVAKSVLSALDLDNMNSEDKKDIIRTVKKTSEEESDDDVETDKESFDFGDEEEKVEESYDSYMDDSDPFDGMDKYVSPKHERRSRYFSGEDSENEWGSDDDVSHEFPSKEDVDESYDSYMGDKFNEKAFNSWMKEMSDMGIVTDGGYDSYMEDDQDKYENPKVAEPTDKNVKDKLLFDSEDDSDVLYGPNSTKRYDRSEMTRAKRQADKDMTSHYYKLGTPGYEERPSEDWAKHRLPYNTNFDFMSETDYMNEDHLNVEMETYEQERAYEDVEKVVRRYGMDVELRKKETSEDPEESLIYLDIIEGDKKLLVARINSVGNIEVGEMSGNKFIGEPIDSVEDFIEIFGEDLTSKEKNSLDILKDTEMNQPKRSPKEQPGQPATKPGKPERKNPSERPSRRPFTAPPHIEPGEGTDPKAGYNKDVDFE